MPGGVSRSLLVNFWYAHPVGHAIEALRYCLGYHAADPGLRISLLLNAATATELGGFCPFVERTYAAPPLDGVPPDWDWIVEDARARQPGHERIPGLTEHYAASDRHFRARLGHGAAGAEPPA